MPVDECGKIFKGASADVRPYLDKADKPCEAKHNKYLAKQGQWKGPTAMAVGLHLMLCWVHAFGIIISNNNVKRSCWLGCS